METLQLWEVLVPTYDMKEDKPFRTRQHREFDNRVRRITGGLTILSVVKGQWVNPDGVLFKERMIPVRVACTREQIEKIIDIVMTFYNQEAVMAYKISEEALIKYRNDNTNVSTS